jgi:hypothetical protein
MLAVSPSPSGFPAVEGMVGRSPVRVGVPFVGPDGWGERIRSSTGTSSSEKKHVCINEDSPGIRS